MKIRLVQSGSSRAPMIFPWTCSIRDTFRSRFFSLSHSGGIKIKITPNQMALILICVEFRIFTFYFYNLIAKSSRFFRSFLTKHWSKWMHGKVAKCAHLHRCFRLRQLQFCVLVGGKIGWIFLSCEKLFPNIHRTEQSNHHDGMWIDLENWAKLG